MSGHKEGDFIEFENQERMALLFILIILAYALLTTGH